MAGVVILSAKRTPIGKFGGGLATQSAVNLGTVAATAAITAAQVAPATVDQAIIGNVLQANSGQNVARQIALGAGLATSSTAMTINQVCGSGLKAVRLGETAIAMGDATTVLVGGTESMSTTPFYAPNMRNGHRLGDVSFVDGMMKDGLADAFSGEPMGTTAENVAREYQVDRAAQDAFALRSHQRAVAAQARDAFAAELAPVTIGDTVIRRDEAPRPDTDAAKLARLKPAFRHGGTVTAGNSSGINDGAAALVLTSKAHAEATHAEYLAELTGYAEGGIDPAIMGYAPKQVIENLLAKTGSTVSDIDLFELNEAFAAQSVAVARDLGIPDEKLNVNGGALALGHPLGASGARILVTLIHALRARGLHRGIAALCVGGGMSVAVAVTIPD